MPWDSFYILQDYAFFVALSLLRRKLEPAYFGMDFLRNSDFSYKMMKYFDTVLGEHFAFLELYYRST